MDVSYVFAGLVVADRDRAAAWYARLLGRPPDMLPNDAEATWQLTRTASLYLVADPGRAGHGAAALVVADLEAAIAAVAASGIAAGEIEQVAEAGRKCVVTDPDGNALSIIEIVAQEHHEGKSEGREG